MKKIIFLSLILSVSNVYGYADCPESGNWIKDGFCELTGGILVLSKYERPLSGDILNNPFQSCKKPWPAKRCNEEEK